MLAMPTPVIGDHSTIHSHPHLLALHYIACMLAPLSICNSHSSSSSGWWLPTAVGTTPVHGCRRHRPFRTIVWPDWVLQPLLLQFWPLAHKTTHTNILYMRSLFSNKSKGCWLVRAKAGIIMRLHCTICIRLCITRADPLNILRLVLHNTRSLLTH